MKTTFAVFLAAGTFWWGAAAWAQNAAPASSPPATPAAAEAGEKFLQIAFDDPPLEIIRTLVDQAQLKIRLDPKIENGMDAAGDPLPKWKEPVTVRWENLTARQALEEFLSRYDIVLGPEDPEKVRPMTFRTALPKPPAETAEAKPGEAKSPEQKPGEAKAPEAAPAADRLPPIQLEDQTAMEAVTTLAQMSKINIQFDPRVLTCTDLEGKPAPYLTNAPVSVKWRNLTPRQAFDSLLDNNNLTATENTNTHVWRVSFKPPPAQEPLTTKIIPLRYANPTNVTAVLRLALTERSKITNDVRTSQMVIQTTEREFTIVDSILEKLDTPTKQVLIEAKILETSRNPKSIKGIDWSGTLAEQTVSFGNGTTVGQTITAVPGAASSASTTLPSGRQITSTTRSPYTSESRLLTDVGLGGLSMDTARGFFPNVAFLSADGARATLSFLNTDSDTEVVATPRAVTLDNETAKLAVTRLYPNYKITPGSPNSPAGADITYTNLGTTLEVTPRIAGTNQVAMRVVPEVGNVDSVDKKIINGMVNEANVYAIRRIETHVLIPSGNTLVMGGLISDNKIKAYTKVPVLGDMPGLGLLFRKESKQRSKANMIIFITPTIVTEGDFQQATNTFLRTKPRESDDTPESPWNSGTPYDWKSGLAPIEK